MSEGDLLDLLDLAAAVDVELWVDGGWGIDALLGRQTRRHGDLDILIERRFEPSFAAALRDRGYTLADRDDTRAWNYVLEDGHGRQVDFHVIERAPDGNWHYGPVGGQAEDVIPAHALTATGVIGGREVRCVTAEEQVRYHTGYAVDADDWADVTALCDRFGIDVPADFDAFRSGAEVPR